MTIPTGEFPAGPSDLASAGKAWGFMMNGGPNILLSEAAAKDGALHASALERAGFEVTVLEAADGLLAAIERRRPQVVVVELATGDAEALEQLAAIHASEPPIAIIAMTADTSLNAAIRAVRAGARDCLVKPFRTEQLVGAVRNVLGATQSRLTSEPAPIAAGPTSRRADGFIGSSPRMQAVYRIIQTAAMSKAALFITGESGTGKEVCAQAVHRAGARRNKPFVAINCSAMPRDLVESELFGHVKGAFTGAVNSRAGAALQAQGGTLFLDEICEMDVGLQAKLLRFLQTGAVQRVGSGTLENVDVRLICATNRDPLAEMAAGRFREDLYYRLHVVPIHLPPLRERGDDILEIAHTLLVEIAAEEGRPAQRLMPCAELAIAQYKWPGNVRQLQSVLRSIVLLNLNDTITAEALPEPIRRAVGGPEKRSSQELPAEASPLTKVAALAPDRQAVRDLVTRFDRPVEPLWMVEKRAIESAIQIHGDNIARAAAALEISPSTVYRKRQAWAAGGSGWSAEGERREA